MRRARILALAFAGLVLGSVQVSQARPVPDLAGCANGAPVVAVVQRNVNVPDYGMSNTWASDTWTYGYTVFRSTEATDTFCILRTYQGTFTSFHPVVSPNETGTIDSRITGNFVGYYVSRATGSLNPDPGAPRFGQLPQADWGCPTADGPAPESCDTAHPTPAFPSYFASGTTKALLQGDFTYLADRGCGTLEESFEDGEWTFDGDITSAQCLLPAPA